MTQQVPTPPAACRLRLQPGSARTSVAVTAPIPEPWSKGQTEGRVTGLKPVKRQMYGSANVPLV